MIRLALVPIKVPMRGLIRAAGTLLLAVALFFQAPLAYAVKPATKEAPASYSMVPRGPMDRYVNGKFDKTGTYVPGHYQAVEKKPFHGYFFTAKPGDRKPN